jgi:hypothetical protein
VTVANEERQPERHGHQAANPAQVEDLALSADDGGDDIGVVGEATHHTSREVEAVCGRADTDAGQGVVVKGDDQPSTSSAGETNIRGEGDRNQETTATSTIERSANHHGQ